MKSSLVVILAFFVTALLPARAAEPAPVPNYPLVNQEGKAFHLYDLKGKYVFVSFIYTRCPLPKMCPLTVSLSNQLVERWKANKRTPPLQVLAVTLDPEYDTAAALKKFGAARRIDFNHFTLVTGNAQTLSDFASQFNVIGLPSDGLVSHNLKSVLLDPTLVELKEYKDNEWTPDKVMKDLKTASEGKKI